MREASESPDKAALAAALWAEGGTSAQWRALLLAPDPARLAAFAARHLAKGRPIEARALFALAGRDAASDPAAASAAAQVEALTATAWQEAAADLAQHEPPGAVSADLPAVLAAVKARRYAEARSGLRRLQAAAPADGALILLRAALEAQDRQSAAARRWALAAIRLLPAEAKALLALATLMMTAGQRAEAASLCRVAVLLQPQAREAWLVLGQHYGQQREDALVLEMIGHRLRALRPDDAEADAMIGNARFALGDAAGAVAALWRTLPASDGALPRAVALNRWSNYLLAANYAPGLSPEAIAADHRRYGRMVAESAVRRAPAETPRDPARQLRIGFVSPDFRRHSVPYFVTPLWAGLDPVAFRIHAYSLRAASDPIAGLLKGMAAAWADAQDWPLEELDRRIRADGIDILVDLAGHTAGNRLALFAGRPAPVQVTWLGHPNTTGLAAMDWRLTDAVADPPGAEVLYTEALWRLDPVFCCYRPLLERPEARAAPAHAVQPPPVLRNGFVTFGSANNLLKLTEPALALWARVLAVVPGARLLIEGPPAGESAAADALRLRAAAAGIDLARLVIAPRQPQYAIYHEIDIALDPLPCNGGTTTCDLLWMGVPLVTLRGEGFAGRMGAALLAALGRPEWAASDADGFVAIARALASDRPALQAARLAQRARMEASPLMDEAGFGRGAGAAFRAMWQRYCGAAL